MFLAFLTAAAAAANQGPPPPFGIAMGTPLEALGEVERKSADGPWYVKEVPSPHPDFPTVGVYAYPETGVCEIAAMSRSFDDSRTGTEIKTFVEQVARGLDSRYGPGFRNSQCFYTQSSCAETNWTFDLSTMSRIHEVSWGGRRDAVAAAGLREITVTAMASDSRTTFAVLRYVSANRKACAAAKRADRERTLNRAVTPP